MNASKEKETRSIENFKGPPQAHGPALRSAGRRVRRAWHCALGLPVAHCAPYRAGGAQSASRSVLSLVRLGASACE